MTNNHDPQGDRADGRRYEYVEEPLTGLSNDSKGAPNAFAQPAVTWSVTELHQVLDGLLRAAFDDEIWVEGEIRNLNRSKNGHVYFDLVDSEQANDSYPPILSITLFNHVRQSVNQFLKSKGGNVRVSDGVRVRIRGQLRLYASRSSIQLRMTGIDAQFTLGVLEQERQKVLAALEADGLLDLNATTFLDPAPIRIALVTSVGSAAHADALHEFEAAGLGFEVSVFDARVQGSDAGRSIAAAIRATESGAFDVLVLVRGGGARTDLAAFDLEVVARAIAGSKLPVFTGIGHEVDTSIADRVAHSSFKTPTAAAAAVCERTRASADRIELHWQQICTQSIRRLAAGAETTTLSAVRLERASNRHLNTRGIQVQTLVHNLQIASASKLTQTSMVVENLGRRASMSVRASLGLLGYQIEALDARSRAHDPMLALARGWSITRSIDGRIVRSVLDVQDRQTVVTRVADGHIQSLVESTASTRQPGTES